MSKNNKYISKSTNIFMIHGLISSPLTFIPLERYIRMNGYINTHRISYKPDSSHFEESLQHVNDEILKHLDNKDDEIVVIGQSFGGNISNNLHKMGRNVIKSICICSPLNGARLIGRVERKMPRIVNKLLFGKPHEYLKNKHNEEIPPHDFHTISFGLFKTDFDGRVFKDETILDKDKHTHIHWCEHMGGFVDPRLFSEVGKILKCKLFIKKLKKEVTLKCNE